MDSNVITVKGRAPRVAGLKKPPPIKSDTGKNWLASAGFSKIQETSINVSSGRLRNISDVAAEDRAEPWFSHPLKMPEAELKLSDCDRKPASFQHLDTLKRNCFTPSDSNCVNYYNGKKTLSAVTEKYCSPVVAHTLSTYLNNKKEVSGSKKDTLLKKLKPDYFIIENQESLNSVEPKIINYIVSKVVNITKYGDGSMTDCTSTYKQRYSREQLLKFADSPQAYRCPQKWSCLTQRFPEICKVQIPYFNVDGYVKMFSKQYEERDEDCSTKRFL